MHELTTENLADYLRRTGRVPPGAFAVEALGWGVSNAVFRVQAGDVLMVVKQSRPRLRTREEWLSNVDRVFSEIAAMRLLEPLLPPGVVPQILFEDRANYCFGMAHAPMPSRNWKELLLAGRADGAIAHYAGYVLGLIHEKTAPMATTYDPYLSDRTVFRQLRIDPFYERIRERRPEVATEAAPLIEQMYQRTDALCHGDFSPKNLLVLPGQRPDVPNAFVLVDYETAHFGDHAMDIGFFLSHLLLKAVKHHQRREAYFQLTRAFWHGYGSVVTQWSMADLVQRGTQHLAVCALARIDGTSPVDYLPEEPLREAVRAFARQLLREKPGEWERVLVIINDVLNKAPRQSAPSAFQD